MQRSSLANKHGRIQFRSTSIIAKKTPFYNPLPNFWKPVTGDSQDFEIWPSTCSCILAKQRARAKSCKGRMDARGGPPLHSVHEKLA